MQLDLKRLGNTRIILTQQDEILTLRLLNYKILTLVSFFHAHQTAYPSANNLVRVESEFTASS